MNTVKIENISPEGGINPVAVAKVHFENCSSQIAILDDYCIKPECNCRNIKLVFFEIVDGMIDNKLFEIKMNVDTWEMLKYEVYRQGIGCDGMIKEFLNEFDDKTKFLIKKRFESGKKFGGEYLRDNIDYSLLRKNSCVRYNDIFNSKKYERFMFEYRGIKYFVIDQYCINPSCNCNDVVLMFHDQDPKEELYGMKFVLRLNFETGKYEIEDIIKNIGDKEIEGIYNYFIKNLNEPNLKVLTERYDRMKNLNNTLEIELSDNSASLKVVSKNLDVQKVGRNDPCICGSGKKYKKCCGSR